MADDNNNPILNPNNNFLNAPPIVDFSVLSIPDQVLTQKEALPQKEMIDVLLNN